MVQPPLFPEHQRVFQAITERLPAGPTHSGAGEPLGITLLGIEASAWQAQWKLLSTSLELMGISHAVLPARRRESGEEWWVLLVTGVSYASHRQHFGDLGLPKAWHSLTSWGQEGTAEQLYERWGMAFMEP